MPYDKPHTEEQVPAAFVLTLAGGRLYADNFDSVPCWPPMANWWATPPFSLAKKEWRLIQPEDNNIFRQRYFLAPVPVAGHRVQPAERRRRRHRQLLALAARLAAPPAPGARGGPLDSIDYFLVYDRHNGFVRETMALLGVGPERLLDVQTHRHLRAAQLVVPSAVRGRGRHFPTWAFEFLRTAYGPARQVVTRTFSPLVYINRRDAAVRRVTNEAEVQALLQPCGFETYQLSALSLAEKAALFAQARVIVSPVGAGAGQHRAFVRPARCSSSCCPTTL